MKKERSWSSLLLDRSSGEQLPPVADLQPWAADRSKLMIGHRFASGSDSRVYRGIYGQQAVAVKIMRAPDGGGDDGDRRRRAVEEQFNAEVTLLSRLRHPNVVQFVAACREPPVYCVITEYMPRGTLRAFLHERDPYSLPPETVLGLALDVARGMEYIHSRGVVHRDLKSQNILLDGGGRAKVADLGTSCLESSCGGKCSTMGTYRWMAPEMIRDKRCNRKVDVYSFGVVLWELTTGLVPFQDMTPVQAAYAVCEGNARPPLSPACPPAINGLIKRCWSAKPAKRPEFSHIVALLESYERCLREGRPMLPQPSPSPSPLAALLGGLKRRSCKNTMLHSISDRRVHA